MDTPQFQKAEYATAGSGERCKLCSQPLGAAYWRVGQAMACQACAEKAKSALPKDSHSAFSRGVLFGIGGAILGLILYATFTIVTGIILGYVSLAVGYIVGKAIHMGSNGLGGRRYQIAAVILTYAAVSLAAIPIGISQIAKQQAQRKAQTQQAVSPGGGSNSGVTELPMRAEDDNSATNAVPPSSPSRTQTPRHVNFAAAIAGLTILGLASPCLELYLSPVQGLIGLVILLFGIRIAWQLTGGPATPPVSGPFRNVNAAPSPAPPSLG